MSGQSISRKMAGGAAWMVCARMVMRLSGLINIIIVARLLPPADFGVVGLTVAFIGAFEAMSDMSLNSAIVRHKDPKRKHYDTVFTLMILRGVILASIVLLTAGSMAAFYGDERLVYVAYAIAAQLILFSAVNPGVSDFQRDFDFRRDFIFLAVRKLASTVCCVTVALTIWPDYRALVTGLIAGTVATLMASYTLSAYRPRVSLAAFGEIFGFSKWMLATNMLRFTQQRLDTFILGKTLGLTALGFYTIALELANLVSTEFAMPLRRAFMPGYAKLQDDASALREQFATAYGAAMLIAIPFAVGVALVAEPAIRMAFGEGWEASVAPMRVLSANGLALASVAFCWPVIIATGNPRKLAPLQIISIIVGGPTVWWASSNYGLTGAAWAMAGMSTLYALLVMRAALRLMQADALIVLRWMPRILAATLAMTVAVQFAQSGLPPVTGMASAAAMFGATALTGIITYPAALIAVWFTAGRPHGPEEIILGTVNAIIRRKSPA